MFESMRQGKVPDTIKSIHEMILALEKPFSRSTFIE
jgi:hypothetical protein